MGAQRKYPQELRDRATRMAIDARKDPASRAGAYRRIREQLGVHPEALRMWVQKAEVAARLGVSRQTLYTALRRAADVNTPRPPE